jgi:hypothetical protein
MFRLPSLLTSRYLLEPRASESREFRKPCEGLCLVYLLNNQNGVSRMACSLGLKSGNYENMDVLF